MHQDTVKWAERKLGVPSFPTEGSGDELGSIGFAQILYRYRYGATPCQVHTDMKMDFFDPAENLKAFAAHTASPDSDCPGAFYAAFASGTLSDTYTNGDGLVGYYPSANGATVPEAVSNPGSDDTYELLAKGIAGYNGGVGFSHARSWPDELKETKQTTQHVNTKTLSFSTAYSISVLHQKYGLPYRTYVWKVISGTSSYCFAYGEQDWLNGKTWTVVKQDAQGDALHPAVGRISCP